MIETCYNIYFQSTLLVIPPFNPSSNPVKEILKLRNCEWRGGVTSKAPKSVKKLGPEPGSWDSHSSAPRQCHAPSPGQLPGPDPSPGNCCLHGLAQSSDKAGKGHQHLWLPAALELGFTRQWLCQVFTQYRSAKPALAAITDLLRSKGCKTQANASLQFPASPSLGAAPAPRNNTLVIIHYFYFLVLKPF